MTDRLAADPGPDPAAKLDELRDPNAHPANHYGTIRHWLPIFASVGALSVLTGLIPFPYARTGEVVIAGGLFLALTVSAMLLPWPRMPQWFWPVIPVGYIGVVALLRDAQGGGGGEAGLSALYFLPVVWLALYEKRSHLVVGLVAMTAALVVPIVVIGSPAYPTAEWRGVLVNTAVVALISFSFLTMVTRDRKYVADMAKQTLLVQQGARQALEAREQLDSLLRAATETSIIGADGDGLVTFFSAGAQQMLGYTADEVVGKLTLHEFVDPEEIARRGPEIADLVSGRAAAPGGATDSIWTYIRRDGTRRRVSAAVRPRPGSDGPSGYVVVASDVTEREQLVAERERLLTVQREVTQVLVEQNQQLRELTQMKDDVVATVSHELRTPLTSIRGFVELLLDRGTPLNDEQVHMLEAIDRSSLQLLRVTENLLADPGRSHDLRLEFVDTDLSALAREAVEAMAATAAEEGIRLSLVAEEPVMIYGDPVRLHQLFANLLSNAIKFTPTGGRVTVEVTALGQFARLDVLDDGPGVAVTERPQIFERFYRLASATDQGIPGTGLGLAIAKSVAEAHNGTIEVVETPGWSTTFRVHLPSTEGKEEWPREPAPANFAAAERTTAPTPLKVVGSEQ